MPDQLPAPPIPDNVDLRTFDDMPLGVRELRDSDTAAEVSDAAFRAAVMLWCAAWHQIPAASLPNDDQKLARLAGYGRETRGWGRVREQALRGFRLCSDGRLYHLYMVEKAKKAWALKHKQRDNADRGWKRRKPQKTNESGCAMAKPSQSHGSAMAKPPHMPPQRHGNAQNREDLSSPVASPSNSTAGSVGDGAGAPPTSRSFVTIGAAEPEFVIVQIATGAKLRIDRSGNCDEVWAPRDCPPTRMTRDEYLDLRRQALARSAA